MYRNLEISRLVGDIPLMILYLLALTAAQAVDPASAPYLARLMREGLTSEERAFATELAPVLERRCAGDDHCFGTDGLLLADSIDLQRRIREQWRSPTVHNRLMARCSAEQARIAAVGVQPWRDCLRRIRNMTTRDGLAAAGVRRLGVTRAGFYQLQNGMGRTEVEYILGDYPELRSASGSHRMYMWRGQGRAMIVATFRNETLVSYSQSGLR